MKILIITGGDSSEREISSLSANNVKKTLEKNGHTVKHYDLLDGYEPIIKLSKEYDVIFPVLHGEEGEGGKLHEFLSKIKKPIVGTRDYKALARAWYKIPFKKYCDEHEIPSSPWKIIKSKKDIVTFGFPCVLKASNGGSSREVEILKKEKDLDRESAKNLINSDSELYVEKFIDGTEITVGILNNKYLTIIEIVPPEGSWFSYENKYSPKTREIPNAPSVPLPIQKDIKELTLKIHNDLNLGTYSRTDYIYADGKFYVLEVNTIPGLTSESLLPKAAKAEGIEFGEFLEILINNAHNA
jgi:D-alanine-D-alanine ligase